ncbi:methyltransferase domain-containing protein [Vulgatibacter incomptus]|uniref:Trans-aconitate 2-methyltransferase n=1 Tax=Vulgatibacter incomptus TaxID=1391653 RepID=A0A0K1PHE2_9BACT|nr:methyltransferase domain-containing protein [Vulgatibacter incomptus]AKU92539.1 Trans-aconitate 2-methyltransferase [Vulgatibacter incomptus]
MDWNPTRYLTFEAERTAPFEDTFGLVHPRTGMRVVDLGCGTGALTAQLAERLPGSRVLGVDSSPAMLERAKPLAGPNLRFERGELQALEGEWDLIFAHASLQWVDDHPSLLARLRERLAPGGQLVAQVPANHGHYTHVELASVAGEPPFREAFAGWARKSAVLGPSEYARLLFDLGFEAIAVRLVVYPHVLADADALVEWMRGTGMRPYVERLKEPLRQAFLDRYTEVLRERAPERPVFFPFERILLAGTRPGN